METTVTLTMEDRKTLQVLSGLDQGQYTAAQAAELLELCIRQVRRKLARFREDGVAGIPHKNRGRRPPNAIPDRVREQVVALADGDYKACNDHHLQELLAEREDIHLSVSSVRRVRRAAGLRSPRKRRPPKHRSKRERKPQAGMMLQIDGSPCRWLGDDGPSFNVIAAIDDATNEVFAVFRQEEDAAGYMLLLRDVIEKRGVPLSLYSDCHSALFPGKKAEPSLQEQLAGQGATTQVGRAARELGIQQIPSYAPQGKGRVEKLFNTLQDRLVVELGLEGIATIEEAKAFLPEFLKRFNAQFTKEPADAALAYRPAPEPDQLQQILCFEFTRVVAKDNTISFGGRRLSVGKKPGPSYAKKTVTVRVAPDGQFSFWHKDKCIGQGPKAEGELRTDPSEIADLLPADAPPQPPKQPVQAPRKPKRREPSPVTPPPNHSWRKFHYGKNR